MRTPKLATLTILSAALGGLVASTAPNAALAQGVPSYGSPAARQEMVRGTVTGFNGSYIVYMRDDRGYNDNVTMHQGTIINPTGIRLVEGMRVSIWGYADGPTFDAYQIEVAGGGPYYGYGYGSPYYGYGYGYPYPAVSVGIGLGWGWGWGGPWGWGGYYRPWGWGWGRPWGYGWGYRGYGYGWGYRGYGYGYRGGYGWGYRGGTYYHGGYYSHGTLHGTPGAGAHPAGGYHGGGGTIHGGRPR